MLQAGLLEFFYRVTGLKNPTWSDQWSRYPNILTPPWEKHKPDHFLSACALLKSLHPDCCVRNSRGYSSIWYSSLHFEPECLNLPHALLNLHILSASTISCSTSFRSSLVIACFPKKCFPLSLSPPVTFIECPTGLVCVIRWTPSSCILWTSVIFYLNLLLTKLKISSLSANCVQFYWFIDKTFCKCHLVLMT